MSNNGLLKLESKELNKQIPEIQKKSSISFFYVSIQNNEKLENSEDINQIFGEDGKLEQIFGYNHSFKTKNNTLKIKGLDGIDFEFIITPLTEKSGISLINFEVKNLVNNLTRKQKHYLQSVFYNLKKSGFNIKYLDDNFSDLTKKDYIIGHECKVGDVCDLITSFKDNFKSDSERIKEIIFHLKVLTKVEKKELKNEFIKKENPEGLNDNFNNYFHHNENISNLLKEVLNQVIDGNQDTINKGINFAKKEIISIEIRNILNFQLALEHIIFTRNEILKKDNKNISDLVLKNALKSSVLVGNHFDEDKIFEIEKGLTDGVLIGSFSILKMLEGKLIELLDFFEEIEKVENNKKKVELIEKVVKTSDDIFLQAEKTARKNGILSILNPKNWFGNKPKQLQKSKKLTKQQEINEAMDVMVEALNAYYLGENFDFNYSGRIVKSIFKFTVKNGDIQKFPVDEGYTYERNREHYHLKSILKKNNSKFVIQIGDKKLEKLDKSFLSGKDQDELINYLIVYGDAFDGHNGGIHTIDYPNFLQFSNYADLEQIFEKYEEFLKMLYFQDYKFEKSKFTNAYQKILYRKGEFYLDENVVFEEFTKTFFEEVGEKFREKQLDKKNIWERFDFKIIEKNNVDKDGVREENNIFDIKIGENIFPIYILNLKKLEDLGKNVKDYHKYKNITIGTSLDNNLEVLQELIKVSNEVNRKNLQAVIKKEVDDILLMNFDEKDWNYENKVEIANSLLPKNKRNNFDVCDNIYYIGNDKVPVKYIKRFDLEEGVLISEEDLLGNNNYGRYYSGHKGKIIKKEFISDVGVKVKYYQNGISGINLYRDILTGEVLNKYIVDYLVYGIKPDVLDTSVSTNKKISLGIKTYYKGGNRVMYEEIGGVENIKRNPQYEEYLEFLKAYGISEE